MKTLCFVTRCHPKRPIMRARCVESVESQTCDDYTHLLLRDDKTTHGYGVTGANKALHKVTDPDGRYVMVLDDDDLLVDDEFVDEFKAYVDANNPDIVFFRGVVGVTLLPCDNAWQMRPIRADIGSFCFAVSKEFWVKYITSWGSSGGFPNMGDYSFIAKCYNNATKVYWMDKMVATTQRVSRGKAEPKPKEVKDESS